MVSGVAPSKKRIKLGAVKDAEDEDFSDPTGKGETATDV